MRRSDEQDAPIMIRTPHLPDTVATGRADASVAVAPCIAPADAER